MRAVEVREFGPPSVLLPVEVPAPEPGAGQVLVDVAYVDTLWLETMVRSGRGGDHFPVTPPYRPGVGVAGTVAAVGDGVDDAWRGRAVVTGTGPTGSCAEQVVLDVATLRPVPDGLGLDVAAALIHDGTTAYALRDLVGLRAGDRVLITAAAGGMGVLLVQLAVAAGATVVAAARGPVKLARVAALGAVTVVDYSAPGWVEQVRAAVGELDVVLDGAGGEHGTAVAGLLAPGARFSGHGTPAGSFASLDPALVQRLGLRVTGIADVQLAPTTAAGHLDRALADAATGLIAPLIGQRFALAKAADAHAAIESRTAVGKTLLVV
jgi:NADPH2:quinone reductase